MPYSSTKHRDHAETVVMTTGTLFAHVVSAVIGVCALGACQCTEPVATHIAEKLHAYTVPRPRPNSRVKDLPDIALLAEAGALDASNLAQAIAETFAHRATHPVPARLPDLPEAWAPVYARMVEEEDLPWADLTRLGDAVRAFLDPVLAGAGGVWEPAAWRWMDDEP